MEINVTIFLQIFFFLVLLLWLSKFLFAPIMRLFDERERRIEGAKIKAIELQSKAQGMADEFDSQYLSAQDEARKHLAHLKHSIDKEHQEVIDRAKSVARERIKKAQEDLVKEEGRARKELMAESSIMAENVISAFLKRSA